MSGSILPLLTEWLETLPIKKRRFKTKDGFRIRVSLSSRALKLGWVETNFTKKQLNFVIQWLETNNLSIPYCDGNITYLISD